MADNAEITKIDETTREKLRQTVAKIERLEEEKKEIAEQIKEVYGEAKAIGFDTKALRQVIRLRKIEKAEREGLIKPGVTTIIEATSGNTGVGLAMVAAVKGYRCIFVMPDKMSQEKIDLLRAYGAEVVIVPTAVAPDSPDSYNGVSERLLREIPNAWRPNQFANLSNPQIHELTTGPEIWEATEGRITHFVAGLGTLRSGAPGAQASHATKATTSKNPIPAKRSPRVSRAS